jgi:ceramide glucosyltransferase
MLSYLLLAIAAIGTISSTVFFVLALLGAARYQRDTARNKLPSAIAPVSVLKPLHGLEPGLRANLESHFTQDHPDFELVFCARHDDDPALRIVAELCAKYPRVSARIVTCGEPPFPNAKVHSLVTLIEVAKHNILILSDSDVYAAPDYIRNVSRPLLEPAVGVVTCLYRGVPVDNFWSRLEALGMSVEMTSGVLIARLLEGMQFALGPTLATRKDVLEKLGGVAQWSEYLAEDFLIGNRAAAAGYQVVLSEHVIGQMAADRGFLPSFRHQTRWMRSTRFSRPKGHFGTGLTFAVPYGLVGLAAGLVAGAPALGFAFLGLAWMSRMLQSIAIGFGVTADRKALVFCWLYPLRDLLGFFVWIASYTGSEVVWRGERYQLLAEGKMRKIA